MEPREPDPLAPVFEKAAFGIAAAMAGQAFGPAGVVAAALVGPFALHAVDRLNELHDTITSAGVSSEELADRLHSDETLAQFVAEATRAAVESDLAAKRALLARAVINGLEDDAQVDMEQMTIRAATSVNTFDVRVLAKMRHATDVLSMSLRMRTGPQDLALRSAIAASFAVLIAAGLVYDDGIGKLEYKQSVLRTSLGNAFIERLLNEGLEDELGRRDGV